MDPVELVRRVEELWGAGKTDELDQYFSPDFAPASAVPMLPPGLAGSKMAHAASMQAFPDRKVEILDIFGSGDKVCVRAKITGTNKGGAPWLNAPPGDKQVAFEFMAIYQVRDDKIVNHWGVNDVYTALIQLGTFTPRM